MQQFLLIRFLQGLFWVLLSTPLARAQLVNAYSADSLLQEARLAKPDTSKVKLLLELAHLYIFRKDELASDLDSALLFSNQAYELSHALGYLRGEGRSYLTYAQAYHEKKEPKEGKKYILQAIDLLNKYGSLSDQGDAYVELATYYPMYGEGLLEKNRLYKKIVQLYGQADNKLKLADALRYRGDLFQVQGDNEQSLKDLNRSLSLYQSIGYRHLQQVYDLLGFVYSKKGDYEGGIRYGLLAIKTAEEMKDTFLLGNMYHRLGIIYKELDEPQKSIVYFNKCLNIAQKQFYKSTTILLANTISYVLEDLEKVATTSRPEQVSRIKESVLHLHEIIRRRPDTKTDFDCRLAVGRCLINYYGKLFQDYARAQPYADQLEAVLKNKLGQDYQIFIHTVLIPFYVESKQYKKTEVLLASNEALLNKASYAKDLSVNHWLWFKVDSAQANYPAAIKHYQNYKALNDSLINERTRQKTSLLEVQYKTRENENKILELRQESLLRENRLQKAETTRNFIIAGAIMLALLLILSYNRYRLKQRSNRELQQRQEEINHKNSTLQLLLTEKEWLLKEIHHRVKNNLQIVMSLLNSQAAYLSDDAALSAIQESGHRVQAMALIHQKLYQSERIARINMPDYIHEVVTYLRESYNLHSPIRFDLSVEDIELDVTQAVPLGLIINEAITNAFKYAFPNGRKGTIALSLLSLDKHTYQLAIADNGVGLPVGYEPSHSRSLGMTLLHGFSAQMGGELTISSSAGLHINLIFQEEKFSPQAVSTLHA